MPLAFFVLPLINLLSQSKVGEQDCDDTRGALAQEVFTTTGSLGHLTVFRSLVATE